MQAISSYCTTWILLGFIIGYVLIVFEHKSRINKAASALLMATICWGLYFICSSQELPESLIKLREHFEGVTEIVFFLIGAMTIVELVDSHKGFQIITDAVQMRSKKKLLWMTALLGFFLSSVLDNLTSTIVMVSLLRKLIPNKKEQQLFGGMMVIATNAGGAWTPIGDVTTTMLWINGQISTLGIIKSLFVPSVVCIVVPVLLLSFFLKGNYEPIEASKIEKPEPRATLIFWLGIASLIFVPIFKTITGMPPVIGMLLGVGVMWLVTDLLHRDETRSHLRVPHVFKKIDLSGALFFLGILLAVGSLEVIGLLKEFADWLSATLPNLGIIAMVIGLVSAVIDNVPLVAATMGMYDIAQFPQDSALWEMIAYAAGTGGSILVIGSAAGVAYMGMEKVDFAWYFKRISGLALAGYLAGFAVYLLIG